MKVPIIDIIVEAELIDKVLELEFASDMDFDVESDVEITSSANVDHYTGTYSITPSATEQILNTEGLLCDENIIINPIPSNYGLITWNGAVLTVS